MEENKMKREIKFRAWDKELKCFGHGCRNQFTDRNNNSLCISDTAIGFKKNDGNKADTALNFNKCSYREIVNQDRYELMQYTGLKDKNGKEIYEGDICKCYMYADEEPQFLEVRFVSSGFTIEYKDSESDIITIGWFIENSGNIDVQGNIYENPNLLM